MGKVIGRGGRTARAIRDRDEGRRRSAPACTTCTSRSSTDVTRSRPSRSVASPGRTACRARSPSSSSPRSRSASPTVPTVWLEDGRALTVASSRPHRDRLLVRFARCRGPRRRPRRSRGRCSSSPSRRRPRFPRARGGTTRSSGCAVETDTGRELGTVREVIHTAANDVWSAVDDDGVETLIPVLHDVLVSVDVAASASWSEIPGLTDSACDPALVRSSVTRPGAGASTA